MDESKINRIDKIEDFTNVSSSTGLLGYDKSANKLGYVPYSMLGGNNPIAGFKRQKGNANPEGIPFGDFGFIASLPSALGLGGYLVQNDHTRRKLATATHKRFASGEDCNLDGTQGHYQWGWNVPFYYSTWEDDTYVYEAIALSPIKGHWNYRIPVGSRSAAGYAVYDAGTGALKSVGTNTIPVFSKSIVDLQKAAHKNGDLWFANERVMHFITGVLMRIIFHNTNIQAGYNNKLTVDGLHQGGLGAGYSDTAPWDNGYLPLNALVEDGDALETGNYTGDTTNQTGTAKSIAVSGIPNFFGLKNNYKYMWCMSEDELLQCNPDKSQTLYIDDSVGRKIFDLNSISGHIVHSKSLITDGGWQYPKSYNFDHLTFWPKEAGGSDSTYYADGYYNPAATSGLRGVILVGSAGDGGSAGSLCADGDYGVGDSNAGWSAFLCEFTEAFDTTPIWTE
ncbi:MAG: hypothetical protein LKE54_03750 [Prevotella sp.]|jgi:hypothetical protein|nr:hypothetical protein [Prevotella sp.]MCH3994161.1 hypothetical protein [Prevotella sp.]